MCDLNITTDGRKMIFSKTFIVYFPIGGTAAIAQAYRAARAMAPTSAIDLAAQTAVAVSHTELPEAAAAPIGTHAPARNAAILKSTVGGLLWEDGECIAERGQIAPLIGATFS